MDSKSSDEPVDLSKEEEGTELSSLKDISDVLPSHLSRLLPQELANEASVKLLIALFNEERGKFIALAQENRKLRDFVARIEQIQKTIWLPPFLFAVGGTLLGAIGWSGVADNCRYILSIIGLAMILSGIFTMLRSNPSKSGQD